MNAMAVLTIPEKKVDRWTGSHHRDGVYPRDRFKVPGSHESRKSRSYVLYQHFSNINAFKSPENSVKMQILIKWV